MKGLIPYLLRELEERKNYTGKEIIETIYFGGGTPSILEIKDLRAILENVKKNYQVSSSAEISFEANPEDLKAEYLNKLKIVGINRLSIGIQSFQDSDLELMHRIHNAEQAINAVKDAQKEGFDNISIDLIYGLPGLNMESWEKNLEKAFSLGVQHFSAYHLTYEPGTIFDHWRKKGKLIPIPEEDSLHQFKLLLEKAKENGFEHYEISNFSLPGYQSRHNTSYWEQKKYLGIGPSAHSYDSVSRRWNVRNNNQYMESIISGKEYYESETLSVDNLYNEFIMTSLRMSKGLNYKKVDELFSNQAQSLRNRIHMKLMYRKWREFI